MSAVTRPLLRWLGGKFRLAPWIIQHLPPHEIYVEPFGGAASVLLRKPRSYNETYNDLDGEVVNLFRVLRSAEAPELLRQLALTPYAKAEYKAARQLCDEPLERARRAIVRSHMAHGTGGARMDRPTGFRTDGRSGGTNVAGGWAALPEALAAVVARLQGVSIQQRPALELLQLYDAPNVLFYLDPPYLPATRSTKSRKPGERYHTYAYELTDADHAAMLAVCARSKAMMVLSGYPDERYDAALAGWERRTMAARAHRNSPRTEVLWINPAAASRLSGQLFAVAALSLLLPLAPWVPIVDGDPLAAAMYDRHYSSARSRARRAARGTLQIVGPAERLVMMTPCRRALWVWRRHKKRDDEQTGLECSIFRNEGAGVASDLVCAADGLADQRWPGLRHFTFIDENQVGGDPPGNCFRHAGWRPALDGAGKFARSKNRGLLILERPALAVAAAA